MFNRITLLLLFIGLAWGQPADSWIQTFGGENNEYGYSVQQTTDGGYIITGTRNRFDDNEDVFWCPYMGGRQRKTWI